MPKSRYLFATVALTIALSGFALGQESDIGETLKVRPQTGQVELPKAGFAAKSTCFCKISHANIVGVCHPPSSSILLDLTGDVGLQTSWPRTQGKAQNCSTACNGESNNIDLVNLANIACSRGIANGTVIRSFDALGNCGGHGAYEVNNTIGTLTNTPGVSQTTCSCPSGWLANTTNVDGGISSDGRCKKHAGTNYIQPNAPNGTEIGVWGFTWGNGFWAWGTAANGGDATCTTTIISSAICVIN